MKASFLIQPYASSFIWYIKPSSTILFRNYSDFYHTTKMKFNGVLLFVLKIAAAGIDDGKIFNSELQKSFMFCNI